MPKLPLEPGVRKRQSLRGPNLNVSFGLKWIMFPLLSMLQAESWTSQREKLPTSACSVNEMQPVLMWGVTGDGIRLGKNKAIFFSPHRHWRTRRAAQIICSSEGLWLHLLAAMFIHWSNRGAEEVLGCVALPSQLVGWADSKQKISPAPAKGPLEMSKAAWTNHFVLSWLGTVCLFHREEQPSSRNWKPPAFSRSGQWQKEREIESQPLKETL